MDRYSRTVAYLKVLLPLAALALLSTLFLISRGSQTDAVIPFAQKEIEDRMQGQQLTDPFFAGTTSDGHEITVMAAIGRPRLENGSGAMATELQAEIRMATGGQMDLIADLGSVRPDEDLLRFEGNVEITSTDGLIVTTDVLNATLSGINASSPGPVSAIGPIGDLNAGSMEISTKSKDGPVQMLFKDGVKLVYDPQKSER